MRRGNPCRQYSAAKAMFSDKNLLTAKPLVGVDEAIDLLQQHAKSEDRKREAAEVR